MVVDVDDGFKAMLGFIYHDLLPVAPADEEECVFLQHLLIMAGRYDLRKLRLTCEQKSNEHIGVSMATTILALDEHLAATS
jgi:speckle-type POZ protein